jgi:hypothetical protein
MRSLGELVDLRPFYQRDISWTQENMCDLVQSVMCNGILPQILLYKLQAEDECLEGKKWECVDGQHRLFTFFHFYNGLPVELPGKKKSFMVSLNYEAADGHTVHIFYKKTTATEAWLENNRSVSFDYMTTNERNHFDEYLLDIKKIMSPLTKDQRRQLFLALQKGVPVKGSDLYKNKTEIPLVKFISEVKKWEQPMKLRLLEHCWAKPKKYWLHWIVRAYMLMQSPTAETFMVKDSEITEWMKKKSARLNTTPETEAAFDIVMVRFYDFLDSLPASVKLTPTHFYTVFVSLLDADSGREAVLLTHMADWVKEGVGKREKKMWESRGFDDAERQEYYEDRLRSLESIVAPAAPVPARKAIAKKVRVAVWSSWNGAADVGACFCCKEELKRVNMECGHIQSHRMRGLDTESNLRPICLKCNRSMATENMQTWMARHGYEWRA